MDRLDMALILIQEAKEEKDRLESFKKEYSKASGWDQISKVYEKYDPVPKKAIINDNLKMARRILVREYVK